MVPIYENYTDYSAPERVLPTVSKLLTGIPQLYLSGLRTVILTNSAAMPRGKTHRLAGRKHILKDCRGFYHPERRGQGAYVELVVDNILAWSTALSTPERDLTESALAHVLFHEIGHHLDFRGGGALAQGREATADAWMGRLWRIYFSNAGNREAQ
jgi:hypothetical protein